MEIEFRLTRVTDGQKPEVLSNLNIGASFETQDVGVEGEGRIQVGNPDADEGDVRDHGVEPKAEHPEAASSGLLSDVRRIRS